MCCGIRGRRRQVRYRSVIAFLAYPGYTVQVLSIRELKLGVRERIEKYRSSGGAAGLVRVEVLVPVDRKADVLKLAASLRTGRRERDAALKRDLSKAIERYGARILDNVDLSAIADVSRKSIVVGNALIERGDARAYAMGRKLIAAARA